MKTVTWAAALLLMTGCVNVSFNMSKKEPSLASSEPAVMADSTLAPSINAFGFDLYRSLAKNQGNLILSPLSVSTVLASLAPGAAGNTQTEILRVLHLGNANANYRALMTALELRARADSAAWAMANRAWVQRGMTLLPGYVDTTRSHFGYEMGVADFIDSANASRLAINQWVESQTQHRIRDLFPEGSIEPSVRLVLANAIYFKGLWQSPFEESETKPATFHLNAHATISVPMMSQTHRFAIGTVAGGHLLELPYLGGNLSMLILLPNEVDGLPALESRLGADSLKAWIAGMRAGERFVLLPRFTSNKHFDLTHTLEEMGMPTAFSGGADFSGMDGRHDLHVGIVVHGAFVDVNEEGTEAAASTGATMRLGAERFGQMFLADRPFLFLIRDRETGCILFMGRVTDPRG